MKFKSVTTIIIASLFIGGCGSEITSNGTNTSTSREETNQCTKNRPTKAIATDCSGFDNNGFKGDVATFYDPLTQKARLDVIRIQLTYVPNTVNSSSYQLEFFGWTENCDGSMNIQSASKGIYIQSKSSGKYYAENSNVSNISSAKSLMYLNSSLKQTIADSFDVPANEFFDKFYIIVNNLADSDQAIYMGAFPTSGGSAISWGNFLLTPHYVNPRVYSDTHIGDDLINLHPFINDSLTQKDDEYYEQSKQFCENMKSS